jgi:hypothetical protein
MITCTHLLITSLFGNLINNYTSTPVAQYGQISGGFRGILFRVPDFGYSKFVFRHPKFGRVLVPDPPPTFQYKNPNSPESWKSLPETVENLVTAKYRVGYKLLLQEHAGFKWIKVQFRVGNYWTQHMDTTESKTYERFYATRNKVCRQHIIKLLK